MAERTIYQFLTAKCKEKEVKIEELPKLCGFSRSTLYRYMKGILYMSSEVEQKFADVLGLAGEERRELSELASLTAFDEPTIRARSALDRFFFGGREKPVLAIPVDCAFYHDDTYLRTADEIFDKILEGSQEKTYRCEVRLVNCLNPNMLAAVSHFLHQLFAASPASFAEHLLSFSPRDHRYNIETLLHVLPLLRYANYHISYREGGIGNNQGHLFRDAALIRVARGGREEYYLVSFLEGRLSAGYLTQDRYFYQFALENYMALREDYTAPLVSYPDSGGERKEPFSALENGTDTFQINSDYCYDMIPEEAYRSLLTRCSQKTRDRFFSSFWKEGKPAARDGGLRTFPGGLVQDAEPTRTVKRTVVHSSAGLRTFAQTGRLSGQMAFLPPFSREERLTVLQNLRRRADEADGLFQLRITREPFLENGVAFAGVKDQTLTLSFFSKDQKEPPQVPRLCIRSRELANILFDYTENHIPGNHAMSQEEVLAFLDELIRTL